MAGKSSSLPGVPGNGSNGSAHKPAPNLVQSGAHHLSGEHQALVTALDGANTMHASLVIERGMSAGKKFPLSSAESNIGRWDADGGVFPDVDLDSDDPEAKVSRRHARISLRDGAYLIEDLGSTKIDQPSQAEYCVGPMELEKFIKILGIGDRIRVFCDDGVLVAEKVSQTQFKLIDCQVMSESVN